MWDIGWLTCASKKNPANVQCTFIMKKRLCRYHCVTGLTVSYKKMLERPSPPPLLPNLWFLVSDLCLSLFIQFWLWYNVQLQQKLDIGMNVCLICEALLNPLMVLSFKTFQNLLTGKMAINMSEPLKTLHNFLLLHYHTFQYPLKGFER